MGSESNPVSESARHVAILLPDLRPGGAERVTVNLANELVARSVQVDLVLMSARGELRGLLDRRVNVVELRVSRLRNVFRPLRSYLVGSAPRALLACMWPLTSIAIAARWFAGVSTRVVVTEHTSWSKSNVARPPLKRVFIRLAMHLTFPHAAAVLTVSQGAADDLEAFAMLPRRSVQVIWNPVVGGLNLPAKDALPDVSAWLGGGLRLIAIGSLKPVKRYDVLISALAMLPGEIDARLLILGEGVCRDELAALATRIGVTRRILMPGFVSDPAVFLRQAHLHVLSSDAEGLPTVIIEALAEGVPTVSTDCQSGPREILGDGELGVLVPVSDPRALSEGILVARGRDFERQQLLHRASDFSVARIADRYEGILLGEQ